MTESSSPDKKGLRRLVRAFFFSISGLRACFRTETAFRHEVFLSVGLIPAAFLLGQTAIERSLLLASIALVLMMEVLNSAIERVVDRISTDRHQLSKEAKDMGSAAVFLSLVLFALIWGGLFWGRIF